MRTHKSPARKSRSEGFTLIELLIVIAIIGILAAVLIPNLLGARKEAFNTGAQNCGRAIQAAQTSYMTKSGDWSYAADVATLKNVSSATALLDDGTDGACGESTITPVSADDEDFTWEVIHANGNTTYVVTSSSINAKLETSGT